MIRLLALTVGLHIFMCFCSGFDLNSAVVSPFWVYPWDECKEMDQIVGNKCEPRYYICDFGDTWFTREVLCNNCIGDCPPGRLFDNATETCVWPNTIGCDCEFVGQTLGDKCDSRYFTCARNIGEWDWLTEEITCLSQTYYDPLTSSCRNGTLIGC